MDTILEIARRHSLMVVEDAAQALMSSYKGRPLGSLGDFGCLSFHETKNYTSGEGGAFLVNNPDFIHRAEIIREKGTNRAQFFRGDVDKYSWQDLGSSYLPSDLNAALLLAQLEVAEEINARRLHIWNFYRSALEDLAARELVELPCIPKECEHNAHLFFIKAKDLEERTRMIAHLRERKIWATFHYVPLHSAPAGLEFGRFHGDDRYTTRESERLVRLPLFHGLTTDEMAFVIDSVREFYGFKSLKKGASQKAPTLDLL